MTHDIHQEHQIDIWDQRKETVSEEKIRKFMQKRAIKDEDYPLIAELCLYSRSFICEHPHNVFNLSKERSAQEVQAILTHAPDRTRRLYEILLHFAEQYHWSVGHGLVRFLEEK